MWYKGFDPLLEDKWRYIILEGGRGGGKSQHTAIAELIRGRQKKKRILCVREHQKSIRDSVHKLLKDKIEAYNYIDYKINDQYITNRITNSEIFFLGLWRNSHNIKSYEAIDEVWVEEAQAVSMESLDYLLPTIRKTGSRIVFTMNRFAENDPVYERLCKNPSSDTCIIKINMMDLPKPFQSEVLIKQMQKDKIDDYDKYLWTWEGEPVGQDPQALLSRIEINKAMEREIKVVGGKATGIDIARFGDDRTTMYRRKGLKIIKWKAYKKLDEPQIIDRAKEFVEYDKKEPIKIDLGYMPGVYDHLKLDGYNVIGVNFGGSGDTLYEPDKYVNVITEMWFFFKSLLPDIQLPNDLELKSELGNRLFLYRPDERKMVEPKKDYKKRHADSPDKADGCLLCYYQPKVKKAYHGLITRDIIGN